MAAAVACKRLAQIGTSSGVSVTRFRGFGAPAAVSPMDKADFDAWALRLSSSLASPSRYQHYHCSRISQLVKSKGKRLFLVDTLALVRRLEAEGLPSKQSEAITASITEVLHDNLEKVSHSVVSKTEMQRTEMTQESNLSKFKSEVQSSQETLLLCLIQAII